MPPSRQPRHAREPQVVQRLEGKVRSAALLQAPYRLARLEELIPQVAAVTPPHGRDARPRSLRHGAASPVSCSPTSVTWGAVAAVFRAAGSVPLPSRRCGVPSCAHTRLCTHAWVRARAREPTQPHEPPRRTPSQVAPGAHKQLLGTGLPSTSAHSQTNGIRMQSPRDQDAISPLSVGRPANLAYHWFIRANWLTIGVTLGSRPHQIRLVRSENMTRKRWT